MAKFMLIYMFLVGCGSTNTYNDLNDYTNPQVREVMLHVEEFKKEALNQNVNLYNRRILVRMVENFSAPVYTEANSMTIGYCTYENGMNVMSIRNHFWKNATLLQQRNLVFHELGHCWLNKPHLEKEKRGIMSTPLISTSQNNTYAQDEQQFLKDLFHSK